MSGSGERSEHLAILGLRPDASWDQIREAYHFQLEYWRVQRFMSSDDCRSGMERVHEAYEALQQSRFSHPEEDYEATVLEPHEPKVPRELLFPLGLFSGAALGFVLVFLFAMTREHIEEPIQTVTMSSPQDFLTTKPQRPPEIEEYLEPVNYPVMIPELALIEETDHVFVEEVKRKDKMYVLSGDKPVSEKRINDTPDIVEASIECDLATVKELLEQGEDPNSADLRGDTALHWASKSRCWNVARYLILNGADVNRKSSNGFTPYVWARLYRSKDIEQLLVESGADTTGGYWWRNDKDMKLRWLKREVEALCSNNRCSRDVLTRLDEISRSETL